jgi:hypothetical protein
MIGKVIGVAAFGLLLSVAFWGSVLYGAYRFGVYQGWLR